MSREVSEDRVFLRACALSQRGDGGVEAGVDVRHLDVEAVLTGTIRKELYRVATVVLYCTILSFRNEFVYSNDLTRTVCAVSFCRMKNKRASYCT